MPLKILKPSMGYLHASPVKRLHTWAPEQVVPRLRGSALLKARDKAIVQARYLCQCDWCEAGGMPLHLTLATMELDHRIPLHLGGTNADANLRALHRDCHARITKAQAEERGWLARGGSWRGDQR
jgi:5-methylcytosine-specific restriction endonuclease McrA